MTNTEKKNEYVEKYCDMLVAYHAEKINIEGCFNTLGALQCEISEMPIFLLGCLICNEIEEKINIHGIRDQIKKDLGVDNSDEKLECLLFAHAYAKAVKYLSERKDSLNSSISKLNMVSEKYGEKASMYLAEIPDALAS